MTAFGGVPRGARSVRPWASTMRAPKTGFATPSAPARPNDSKTASPFSAMAMPAPIALGSGTRSTSVTFAPARARKSAVAHPLVAAPEITTKLEARSKEERAKRIGNIPSQCKLSPDMEFRD